MNLTRLSKNCFRFVKVKGSYSVVFVNTLFQKLFMEVIVAELG